MEAAAAIGVAAAAVQFLHFSLQTLALCKEIRDSTTSSTKANEELTKFINKLVAMQKDLRKHSSTSSSAYRKLIGAVQDCSAVATELLQLLEHIRDQSRKSMGALRSAIQAIKKRKTIERLQSRLADCETKYHLALTTDMRDEVLRLLEKQGKSTESMRDMILQRLDSAVTASEASHSITHDRLDNIRGDINQSTGFLQQELSTLSTRQESSSEALKRGQLTLGQDLDGHFANSSTFATHQQFLDRLYFEGMFVRQESIKKNLPGTYQWVRDGKLPDEKTRWWSVERMKEDEERRGSIVRWLRSKDEDRVFWVSGKPGSGKTSLMTFIMTDSHTIGCLEEWAGRTKPQVFSYFFWKPGSTLQKTTIGLWRSLLWQICKANPGTIDLLLSHDRTLLHSPWTEQRLIDALRVALSAYRNDPAFFLIDGLDECEGSHDDLLDDIQALDIGLRTKVCVSSRPEESFQRRLGALPSIRLQDVNFEDIKVFASSRLKERGDQAVVLARDVAEAAEGVFLWAVLVCKSLCTGIQARDDHQVLRHRLHAYPQGLDELFKDMFAGLEDVHQKSLALYFYAARQDHFSVALAAASHASEPIFSLRQFATLCEREAIRVTTQSRGLLQLDTNPNYTFERSCVHYRAWAVSDLPGGEPSQAPLNDEDHQLVCPHFRREIKFVHRSAYDYIHSDASNARPGWLQPFNDSDIVARAFEGAMWLLRYGPTYHSDDFDHPERTWSLLHFAEPAVYKADLDVLGEAYLQRRFTEHLDALYSWQSAQNSSNDASLVNILAGHTLYWSMPLGTFWSDIMVIKPSFVTSNLHRIWNREDTYSIIVVLLRAWSLKRFPGYRLSQMYKQDMDTAMHSALSGSDGKQTTGMTVLACAISEGRKQQFGMLEPTFAHEDPRYISWYGTDAYQEAPIVSTLAIVARRVTKYRGSRNPKRNDSLPNGTRDSGHRLRNGILDAIRSMNDTWRSFWGVGARSGKPPLPLQLSFPIFRMRPPTSGEKDDATIVNMPPSRFDMVLRLSCFSRRGSGSLKPGAGYYQPTKVMAACHLSVEATKFLMQFSTTDLDGLMESRFFGSAVQRSDCEAMVMAELWENPEGQLTAWEQLYIRACVRKYFVHFWTVKENDDESEAEDEDSEAYEEDDVDESSGNHDHDEDGLG